MKAISDFAAVARAFCDRLRGPLAAVELVEMLVELHQVAMRLPDVGGDDLADLESSEPIPAPLPELPFDIYWVIFDPLTREPGAPVAGSLADDLTDIRAALLRGLAYFDVGRAEGACWEWRFNFYAHWGAHLVNAQQALFAHLRL